MSVCLRLDRVKYIDRDNHIVLHKHTDKVGVMVIPWGVWMPLFPNRGNKPSTCSILYINKCTPHACSVSKMWKLAGTLLVLQSMRRSSSHVWHHPHSSQQKWTNILLIDLPSVSKPDMWSHKWQMTLCYVYSCTHAHTHISTHVCWLSYPNLNNWFLTVTLSHYNWSKISFFQNVTAHGGGCL